MPKSILPIIMLTVLFSACEKDMPAGQSGNPAAGRKVLIAGTTSAFKRAVIGQLMTALGTNDYSFTTGAPDRLSSVQIENYHAVLLVTSVQGGKIDGLAQAFIKENNSDRKIVLFYTRGSDTPPPDWAKINFPVDAVSSASVAGRENEIAEKLAVLIRKNIGR